MRLGLLTLQAAEIFVCENPAVLRAATRLGPPATLVCTEGTPSAALHALLAAASRVWLRWRSDFDWPGIRMTTSALTRYPRATPWRMTVDDYQPAADGGPPLLGTPAVPGTPLAPLSCKPPAVRPWKTAARQLHRRPALTCPV